MIMINEKNTQKINVILEEITNSLNEYNTINGKINENVNGNYKFKINFTNERSIAYYVSNKLEKLFKNHFDKDAVFLNECSLQMEQTISRDEVLSECEGIEYVKEYILKEMEKKKSKRNFIPDLLISTKDIDGFVEYKCDVEFKYIKLAIDYLKYKLYVKNSTKESFFVYMIFEKSKVIKLTNNNGKNTFQFLSSDLKKDNINDSNCAFIYYNNMNNEKDSTTEYDYNDKIKTLSNVNEKIEEVLLVNDVEQFNTVVDFSENYFIKSINKIGTNVIQSQIISNNIELINELLTLFVNKYYKDELILASSSIIHCLTKYKCEYVVDDDLHELIKKICITYNNDITSMHKKTKDALPRENFSVSYKRSNWIIILILMACKQNNIVPVENFESFESLNNLFEDNVKLHYEFYNQTVDMQRHLTDLAFGLMYYSVNCYKSLFHVENSNYVTLNEQFKCYKYKNEIITDINKKFKRDKSTMYLKCDLDDSIEEIGKKVIESLMLKI